MGYVQAGYSIVLAILFVYALSLLARRRRLARAVSRLAAPPPAEGPPVTESLVTGADRDSGRVGGAGPERVGVGPDPAAGR